MTSRATTVTQVCGWVGVGAGVALAGWILGVRAHLMEGVFAVLAALAFVEVVAARAARLLNRSAAQALWLYPVLGVGALASASVGVTIANIPIALSGPAYDRYSWLVKPVLAGVLFGSPFALMVGFLLGITAMVVLAMRPRAVTTRT